MAQDELQHITHSIAVLGHEATSWSSYFHQLLQLTTTAISARAGAVWQVDRYSEGDAHGGNASRADQGQREQQESRPFVIAEMGDLAVGSREARGRVVQRITAAGHPTALAPHSTSIELGAANPSDHRLLLLPVRLEGRVIALVEIFQRGDCGPAVQRGAMAYLVQVGELAERFLERWQLRRLRAEQDWLRELEQFTQRVHDHLGVDETAYCVVNEARRLISADRVSLVLGTGRQCRVKVVSGLDNVDRRAEQVRQLSRLAACVMRGREPAWLDTCVQGGNHRDLPPQIEQEWDRYVDRSHVRRCGIIPLAVREGVEASSRSKEPWGALVFEQLADAQEQEVPVHRVHQLCRHATSALHNAGQHESVFLMPLWRLLGNMLEALGGRHFGKTLLVTVAVIAAALALTATSSDFTIPVQGKLQPLHRRTIFAGEAGIISAIHVEHGQEVLAGQLMVEMRNTDLDVEITTLVGKQTATREQIFSLQRALLSDRSLDPAQQNQLHGDLQQQQQLAESIDQQLGLLRRKEQQLMIRAESAGQVVTWHVRDRLLHRPVQQGQALLSLIDPRADWELELYVPVRHSGHVLDAWAEGRHSVPVTFALSSHPGETFPGTLQSVDQVAVDREELGSTVCLRVAIDARQLPELKTDATVVAKIHCGRTTLGYAWFHDLCDAVRSRVLFWF